MNIIFLPATFLKNHENEKKAEMQSSSDAKNETKDSNKSSTEKAKLENGKSDVALMMMKLQ